MKKLDTIDEEMECQTYEEFVNSRGYSLETIDEDCEMLLYEEYYKIKFSLPVVSGDS